jgi:DNA-binding transcriptional MerR regulator
MSEAMFDLVSIARRGPGRRDRLSPSEIAQIARTTQRVPEAMVKVLSKGATTSKAVKKHLDYIGRYGQLELETDDGTRVHGDDVGAKLTEDWDLDIEEDRLQSDLSASRGRAPAKLVHKLIFSMPPGTSPSGVLVAVRNFAREEFALKHRYAFALHTDELHPHVHLVVKAMGEHGQRLYIRKDTLREWRIQFARHLRDQGIAANATPRYVRGETKPQKSDGIYRATLRAQSSHMRDRVETVARELTTGGLRAESGKATLLETRQVVRRAWQHVSDILVRQGQSDLSAEVRKLAEGMRPPMTDREWIAEAMVARARESRNRESPRR